MSLKCLVEFKLLLLHDHPEYLEECCAMLNCQWKRSEAARMHSLCKSSGSFPCSLLLVECKDHKETLLGHCRMCRILNCSKSCWIESFLISPNRRGQGLGRLFLKQVEEFAKNSGFSTVYLMTEDKEEFYKHMGYWKCSPVSAISGAWQPPPSFQCDRPTSPRVPNKEVERTVAKVVDNPQSSIPPPPPPPPSLQGSPNIRGKPCVWMMRTIDL